MKKKALLFGSLPALAIASGLFLSNSTSSEGSYSPRLSSHLQHENPAMQGASEYHYLLKGNFTDDDWRRAKNIADNVTQDRATFNWIDQGPDNIGGRTRGIVIDRSNINHIYAGSVSGGLFESINRGGTWSKVESFTGNNSISSICQTIDGTFYVGTGHWQERTGGSQQGFDSGARGWGLYKSEADGSWTLIEGTEDNDVINEVVCDDVNNVVWFATDNGLQKYEAATNTVTEITAFDANTCMSLSISKDGTVLIGQGRTSIFSGTSEILVSNDAGATFTSVSNLSETEGKITMGGVGRCEFAISHEKVDGQYRVYGLAASGNLKGAWRSADNGNTWNRIAPEYDGTPGGFSPFGSNGQGLYNNIITVVPGAPDRILIGGINCYSWSTTGNWEQISQSFASPISPLYVHADNHEMVWDAEGRLYIGNDGGVNVSDNANTDDPSFFPSNRGYNVTQFFASGASAHGDVIGGTQDNGVQANYHTGTTYQEHVEIGGGDGFSAAISFINRNITFGSLYFSGVYRSSDRGSAPGDFFPTEPECDAGVAGLSSENECGQFVTNFELWENPNDIAAKDIIKYIPSQDFAIGETIMIPSATTQTFIPTPSPINVVYDDTLCADLTLTITDTVVTDSISGSTYNLGDADRDWEFISGGPSISTGDSILIYPIPGVEAFISDTVYVESFTDTTSHYFGTNEDKPGQTVDMGDTPKLLGVSWDTLTTIDKVQSWLALDMGGNFGVWLTRNSLRFSATEAGWFNMADLSAFGGGNDVSSMEFSKDGDHLFIGTWSGKLFRLSGFNEAYSPTAHGAGTVIAGTKTDTLTSIDGEKHLTTLRQIAAFPGPITGIASGPLADPEYAVVTLGNFAGTGKVRECTNAATADNATFTTMSAFPSAGEGSATSIPCYAVVVDRDDINRVIVGTEFGVYATEDGGSTWNNVSGGFGNTPVYDMQQNWRTWNEGCFRPGEIYVGTHGRGIWSTDVFLNLPSDNDNADDAKELSNLKLFPNPMIESGNVEFDLDVTGDVTLQVFNLNGQVVNQVTVNNLLAGKNIIAFDASELPTGTYVLRLSSENMSETTKFIKR